MKKILIMLLTCLCIASLAACGNSQDSSQPIEPTEDINDSAIEEAPYPEDGQIIATIEGEKFPYNIAYEFKVNNEVFSADPADLADNDFTYGDAAIFTELVYREGLANESISVSAEDISEHKEVRKNVMMQEVPGAADMLNYCLRQDNLTEEEYWANLDPYIEKFLIWQQAIKIIDDKKNEDEELTKPEDLESYRAETTARIKTIYEDLKVKYNVVLTATAE